MNSKYSTGIASGVAVARGARVGVGGSGLGVGGTGVGVGGFDVAVGGAGVGVAVAVGALGAPPQAVAKVRVRPKATTIVNQPNLRNIVRLPV